MPFGVRQIWRTLAQTNELRFTRADVDSIQSEKFEVFMSIIWQFHKNTDEFIPISQI